MKTKRKPKKPLITVNARRMLIEVLSKRSPITEGNLRWMHYLVERAMDKHGIKPYPRKAGRG